MEVLFGPWPYTRRLSLQVLTLEPLADAGDVISRLASSERASKGWFYPPLVPAPSDTRPNAPLVPTLAYSLSSTHRMVLETPYAEQDLPDFLIATLSLIEGMRLTREGWSHFYKAPLERHKLTDLVLGGHEIMEVLRIAADFWLLASPDIRTRFFGAVHGFLFATLYDHDFERFGGYYTVLDTLHWIHARLGRPSSASHAARVETLATHYSMPIPPWGVMTAGKCRLSELRNELVHEGRYAGAPTGFAHPTDYPGITLDLGHFITRLIIAILGVPCHYSITQVNSRQRHGIDLVGPLQAV